MGGGALLLLSNPFALREELRVELRDGGGGRSGRKGFVGAFAGRGGGDLWPKSIIISVLSVLLALWDFSPGFGEVLGGAESGEREDLMPGLTGCSDSAGTAGGLGLRGLGTVGEAGGSLEGTFVSSALVCMR